MIIIRRNDGQQRLAGIGWLAATTGQPRWLPLAALAATGRAGCHWPRWLPLAALAATGRAGCHWLWQADRLVGQPARDSGSQRGRQVAASAAGKWQPARPASGSQRGRQVAASAAGLSSQLASRYQPASQPVI
ncbi:unnamed protein product [Gadus morhua 'NCC']